jgi:methionine sulfoxide reductase heme-binding subunit
MQTQIPNPSPSKRPLLQSFLLYLLIAGAAFIGTVTIFFVVNSPLGSTISGWVTWALAINSQQVTWYVTRAAGLIAYLLLWLSTIWGLAVSSKIMDSLLHRTFTYDFHQFISLLALGFLGLHMSVLLFDHYQPYTLLQVLFPVFSPYRPLWVAIGGVAMYLSLLVTVTYYLRGRIGMKTFRAIHVSSLVAYLGATLHSLFSGTDTALLPARLMYFGSFLVVVFLVVYWLIARPARKPKLAAAGNAAPPRSLQSPTAQSH